jgi:hypothetical protein
MGDVLTTGSSITCDHGGTVTTQSTAKLKVGSNSVLLKSSVDKQPMVCPNQTQSTTSDKTASVSAGDAKKLKVGGDGVLVANLFKGEGDGSPKGTLSAKAQQSKLKAE